MLPPDIKHNPLQIHLITIIISLFLSPVPSIFIHSAFSSTPPPFFFLLPTTKSQLGPAAPNSLILLNVSHLILIICVFFPFSSSPPSPPVLILPASLALMQSLLFSPPSSAFATGFTIHRPSSSAPSCGITPHTSFPALQMIWAKYKTSLSCLQLLSSHPVRLPHLHSSFWFPTVSFQAAIGFYSLCNLSSILPLPVTQWESFPASLAASISTLSPR